MRTHRITVSLHGHESHHFRVARRLMSMVSLPEAQCARLLLLEAIDARNARAFLTTLTPQQPPPKKAK